MSESRTYNITVILICEILQNQVRIYKMLTSAGGILALLQDSPHVRDGASSNDEIRLKVGDFLVLKGIVSRDGFGFLDHAWSVLGLNRGRGQFFSLKKLAGGFCKFYANAGGTQSIQRQLLLAHNYS
jgi:hypothetical protein